MNAKPDPTLLRKRRTVETASLVARGVGLLCTVAFLAHALGPMSREVPPAMRTSCLAAIVLMIVGNGLAGYNGKRADRRAAADLADRLRAEIVRPVDLDGSPARVGASIGVAWRAAGEPIDLDALARSADEAMYREKATAR